MKKKILIIFSILWSLAILSFLIWLPIGLINHLKKSEHGLISGEKVSISIGLSFIILLSAVFLFFINFQLCTQSKINKISFISLSFIKLNVFAGVAVILYYENQGNFKKNFRSFNTFELIISGIIVALYFMLNWIKSLMPTFPFFFSIPIETIPLFFFAFIASYLQCLVTFAICGILKFVMPGNDDAQFLPFLFDYFLPIMSISIGALLKPYNIKEEKSITKKVCQWGTFILIPSIFYYLSRVIAGELYWFDASWGYNKWAYSFVYNLFNMISHVLLISLTVPTICTTVYFIKEKYYS